MNHPDHPLVFLHLPKTAGTTLNAILLRQFSRDNIYFLRSKHFEQDLAMLKAAPENARYRIRLLQGHQPFGLHTWLAPGAKYLAVLRDPVARIISHYHYVKTTNHPMFINAIREGEMSLLDYAKSGVSGELENGQTRWIAGIWDDRPLTEAHLDQAIENIEKHFSWLGLTEAFDESMIDLALRYRWPRIHYRKKNVLGGSGPMSIPRDAIDAITERNQLDIKLHSYAMHRHQDRSAAYRLTRSAAATLLGFANRAGSLLRPVTGA